MKTIILILTSFFLISCGQEDTNPYPDTDTEEPKYTVSNNTEEAIAHITYQGSTTEIPTGECVAVSESQFKELQIEVKGIGKISNLDNSALLCNVKKPEDCTPGNYTIENNRWLGGLIRDTYVLEKSDQKDTDCIILSE